MPTQEEQLYTTNRPHPKVWIASTAAILLLLSLPSILPPDGQTHPGQFLGRFHVGLIHLPIGLLFLVPVFDLAAKKRPALQQAAAITLNIATITAFLSALLGIILAHAGAFSVDEVRTHLWTGIVLAIAAIAITQLRTFLPQRALLTIPLALLTLWTAHTGGKIVYGDDWLTEFLPHLAPSRSYPSVDPEGVYAKQVQPILNANCVKCHGSQERKGNLRLDSYGHLLDGGTSGDIVAAGHPERSILLHRITLPPNDPKLMPKKGEPLTPAEIETLRAWITAGASPSATPTTQP
ncbi:c-type cytochrome domain-containing protein [Terriglobus sp. TAA 43]|uniref:c-type cytochrome domain-containing protein n=1 Tax=Terriglobus sp. TAA 43 TaxID=278961 RepID=UPI00064803E4|nr:c-type cytochrome domain-containing protein [Terriglobus sp. TAA 43]